MINLNIGNSCYYNYLLNPFNHKNKEIDKLRVVENYRPIVWLQFLFIEIKIVVLTRLESQLNGYNKKPLVGTCDHGMAARHTVAAILRKGFGSVLITRRRCVYGSAGRPQGSCFRYLTYLTNWGYLQPPSAISRHHISDPHNMQLLRRQPQYQWGWV